MNFLSKFFIKFFSLIALLLVFGCSQKPAKIVNRSKVLYNKTNQFNLDKYQNYSKKTSKKITNEENKELNSSENSKGSKISQNQDSNELSSNHKSQKNLSKNIENNSNNSQQESTKNSKDQQNLKNSKESIAKEIIIENSDLTIYDLAKKHQISIREIIDFNNLKAPYKLKKGDHLLIPKAQFHIVKKGETLFSISRLYNMKIEEIISANSLIKPYGIKVGNKLQIANFTNSNLTNNQENKITNNIQNSIEKNHEKDNSSSKNFAQNNSENSTENSTKNNSQNLINPSKPNSNSINKNLLSQEKSPNNLANNNPAIDNSQENSSTENTSTNNNSQDVNYANNEADNSQASDKKNIFSWPVRGAVISKFGPKKGGLYNDGINIKAREGASVGSAEDGVIAYAGNELKGYGNLVIIKHSQGWITAYAHLKEFNVKRGQKILKSQKIGLVGSTGSVNFPQLYFGLRKGREAVNPQIYLKSIN